MSEREKAVRLAQIELMKLGLRIGSLEVHPSVFSELACDKAFGVRFMRSAVDKPNEYTFCDLPVIQGPRP